MSKAGKVIQNTLSNTCPKCEEGKVWRVGALKAFWEKEPMYVHCPNCGLKYEREIGFWQGTMYVSYALSVAAFVAGWIAGTVFFDEADPFWYTFVTVLIFIVVSAPFNWRWSRLLWLNFFTNEKSK